MYSMLTLACYPTMLLSKLVSGLTLAKLCNGKLSIRSRVHSLEPIQYNEFIFLARISPSPQGIKKFINSVHSGTVFDFACLTYL